MAAAPSESEKSSATGLSVYLAVLNNGAGLQRAAVEAYSKRDATSTSVLQSIRDAKAVADNEANTLVTLASTQANNANTTLLNVQDFIIDQTGAADINAASAISRENRFLNLKVLITKSMEVLLSNLHKMIKLVSFLLRKRLKMNYSV